jgi:hypothetical protein
LKDEYKLILKYNKPKKIFENMVIRGFSEYYNKEDVSEGIILNKEGLVLGEVIYELDKKKPSIISIYSIYSWLMNIGGAWIIIILFLITIFSTIIFPLLKYFWVIYAQIISFFMNLFNRLFLTLLNLF